MTETVMQKLRRQDRLPADGLNKQARVFGMTARELGKNGCVPDGMTVEEKRQWWVERSN